MKPIHWLANENQQIKIKSFADQNQMTFSGRGPANGNQQMKVESLAGKSFSRNRGYNHRLGNDFCANESGIIG